MDTLPLLSTSLSIDPVTQLKPIGMVGSFPLVVVANPSVKFRDLKQLVAVAKAAPTGIDVGSSGVGSSGHVATEIFARTAGVNRIRVPYKGGLPALQGTVAGDIPMMWSSVGAAPTFVNSGRLVAIAVASTGALSANAQRPRVRERGYPGIPLLGTGLHSWARWRCRTRWRRRSTVTCRAWRPTMHTERRCSAGVEHTEVSSAELSRLIRSEYDRNRSVRHPEAATRQIGEIESSWHCGRTASQRKASHRFSVIIREHNIHDDERGD